MNLIEKKNLKGHDVYQFCYAENHPKNYPENWNENSLFLTTEDFLIIAPYLDEVFSQYHYYGPQKVTLIEWESVKKRALIKESENKFVVDFFNQIDNWLKKKNGDYDYFWILGV